MIIPSFADLRDGLSRFIKKEEITWHLLLKPRRIYLLLMRHGYLQFFLVGGGGVILNLGVTWALTTFVFGLTHYFTAYLIGIGANLVWSFVLYSFAIFKTKSDHVRRLVLFTVYFVVVTWFNTLIVKTITPLVGLRYYLLVIAATIMLLSTINFFVFKLSLFKEQS